MGACGGGVAKVLDNVRRFALRQVPPNAKEVSMVIRF